MKIQLSEHFTYGKLLRFTFPSICMMIFTSIYGVVDGVFVSNFVGKTPFAAINLILPFLMIFGTVGFMIGTGGSALIAKTLGEGKKEKANSLFSMLIFISIAIGLILSVLSFAFLRPAAILLGAKGEMVDHCVVYGRILSLGLIPFILQNEFQSLLITAQRQKLGLWITVAAGITNMVLDALLVGVWRLGLAGAAIATVISQIVGGVIPLIYFLLPNKSLLRLGKFQFDGHALAKTCGNGSSEFMTNVSMSLVNMLYNFQLMRYAGENGIAAYGVIMYVNFIFIAVMLGHAIGAAPIVSFHYGAGNHAELKGLFQKNLTIVLSLSVMLTIAAVLLSAPLARLFVGYSPELSALTKRAFFLYSTSFLLAGVNIFGSSFFTALNDGLISALISFLRTLLFQVAAVLLLPLILNLDGIWLSMAAAELCAAVVTILCFIKFRKKYHY